MLFTETTGLGTIRYDQHIIGNIIRHVVAETDGAALLSDPKGRIRRNPGKPDNDDVSFMELKRTKEALDIRCCVVVKFGAGIQRTASVISGAVRREVSRITGETVGTVTIVVTGVLAKNLSKRHIEVTAHA
ncbi:MAG: Asp23/Gls24 family envelope stress response protein [Clostridiales Family XIII bacterium]|jgi:uncharacterized alkaline shock family protein YloU|nr:Asp23/Gls24 family envelope stress response protein [Clostridiales Family XIII bacterium]